MTGRDPRPLLVVCANSFWNLQNFRAGLLQALDRKNYRLTLAAAGDGSREQGCMPGRLRSLPIRSDGLNPLQDARLFWSILRLLREERPLALLGWTAKPNIYGALAARLLGIPSLPNVSGLGTAFLRGGLLRAIVSLLYRAAFARCPAVFFQNAEDARLFVDQRLVRSAQVRILPGSGVDLERFALQPPPAETDGLRLLFVGRLLGDKGVRELAGAARLLRAEGAGVRIQLLGPAAAQNRSAIGQAELQQWVREGIVEYLGQAEDVRPFLARAHAVILPSYREGLPRSLLEAAAVGRPLLASDVPGCRDVVEHGRNGLLFRARSADDLALAVRQFLRFTPEERQRMGVAARRTVEQRFSEQQVIGAYLRELQALRQAGPGSE